MSVHNRINCSVLIALCVVFSTQSCAGVVKQSKRMQLESKIGSPKILRLCNYGDDVNFYKQSEKLVKGHLFKDEGEEYGYYVIKYHTFQRDSLACIFISAYLSPLILLGLPVNNCTMCLQAKLYIFDSQGMLVKEYEDDGYIRNTVGLYYGHNLLKKMERKYSSLYEGMFEVATYEATKINDALKKAGPINDENENIARTNIDAFFKDKGGVWEKTAGAIRNNNIPQVSMPNQQNIPEDYQEKKPFNISDFNAGLEIGRYYCVQYKNMSIQMLFGILTLQDGNKSVAVGNYKSYGNKLVVSFYEGELKGQTLTYIIEDSKHFRHSVDEENWVHESVR